MFHLVFGSLVAFLIGLGIAARYLEPWEPVWLASDAISSITGKTLAANTWVMRRKSKGGWLYREATVHEADAADAMWAIR